jgi:Protein of unknown function (DUF3429)
MNTGAQNRRPAPEIPNAARLIGLASLIPFVWGAATTLNFDLQIWALNTMGSRFIGPYIQVFYGGVILSFSTGMLWGFVARAEASGQAATGYVLAALPALWVFLTATGGPATASASLIAGYVGLILLDLAFVQWRLAPDWWLRLRLPLNIVAIACLATGVFR